MGKKAGLAARWGHLRSQGQTDNNLHGCVIRTWMSVLKGGGISECEHVWDGVEEGPGEPWPLGILAKEEGPRAGFSKRATRDGGGQPWD